jgi:penicillin-binding protein 2
MSLIIYTVGIIIVLKLFSLQIVNGEEYLDKSNSRLTRETTVKASRGNILDCNGNILAGTKIKYSLELYKSKIETKELNAAILNVINVLEENGDKYIDNFPITINPIQYEFSTEERTKKWLEKKEIDVNSSANDALNYYIKEYELENYSLEEIIMLMQVVDSQKVLFQNI